MIRRLPLQFRHAVVRHPIHQTRRSLFTPPAQQTRSWKSSAVRWGLAGFIVYYYNTSKLFADAPQLVEPLTDSPIDDAPPSTLDSVATSGRPSRSRSPYDASSPASSSAETSSSVLVDAPIDAEAAPGPRADGEEEEGESSGGAFNEETGEINWDCPCLGGMAHGPCGEQFRAAFSCFVFSKEEPKGVDCIENFKTMQGCFREHADVYGAELDDEDDEGGPDGVRPEGVPADARVEDDSAPAKAQTDATTATAPVGSAARSENNRKAEQQSDSKLSSDRSDDHKAQSLPPLTSTTSSSSSSPSPPSSSSSSSSSFSPSSTDTNSRPTPAPTTKAASKVEAVNPDPDRDIDEPVPEAAHDARKAK